MSRPNILILQADQLTAKVLPMYGKPMVITPNLSRLAETEIEELHLYVASEGILHRQLSGYIPERHRHSTCP